jgi:hypothetical protein
VFYAKFIQKSINIYFNLLSRNPRYIRLWDEYYTVGVSWIGLQSLKIFFIYCVTQACLNSFLLTTEIIHNVCNRLIVWILLWSIKLNTLKYWMLNNLVFNTVIGQYYINAVNRLSLHLVLGRKRITTVGGVTGYMQNRARSLQLRDKVWTSLWRNNFIM